MPTMVAARNTVVAIAPCTVRRYCPNYQQQNHCQQTKYLHCVFALFSLPSLIFAGLPSVCEHVIGGSPELRPLGGNCYRRSLFQSACLCVVCQFAHFQKNFFEEVLHICLHDSNQFLVAVETSYE